MNIYVSNIAHAATEDQIKNHFAQFGEVTSVKIIKDRMTGKPRGFAFVEMPSKDEAQAAIDALNNTEFLGRALRVNEALPKPEGESRGPRREGNGGGFRGGNGGGFRSRF